MMARTKPIRRSYAAGEWGRNRVRVFPDPKTSLFQIEWRENGRRLSKSLKHRDWARAKSRTLYECRRSWPRRTPQTGNQAGTASWAAGPLGRWAAGPLGRWAAGPLKR